MSDHFLFRLSCGDDGDVYFQVADGVEAARLAALDTLPAGSTVLAVAGRRNAPLVAKLGERAAELVVRLAPACWASPDPRQELAALSQPCGDSRGGAWRRLTPPVGVGYALADDFFRGRPYRDRLASHPAWPCVRHAPPLPGAALLAHLLDPFLYEHPDRPGRDSRLFAYFGLLPGRPAAAARKRRALADLLADRCPWLDDPPGLARSRRYARVVLRYWKSRLTGGPEAEAFSAVRATGSADAAARLVAAFHGDSAGSGPGV